MKTRIQKRATKRAIKQMGGLSAASREFRVSRQAILQWIENGVPAERVPHLSYLTGVQPNELRPDVWNIISD